MSHITSADRIKAQRFGEVNFPDGDVLYDGPYLELSADTAYGKPFEWHKVHSVVDHIRRTMPGYDFVKRSNETVFEAAERWEVEAKIPKWELERRHELGLGGR